MICHVVPLAQGFKRIRSGVDSGAWYNEWFVRGSPHEMKNMVRVKIKGNANNSTDGSTSSGSGSGDDDNLLDGDPPDFYAMTSQQQPEPGNMKTAMKPCSSSKMEFKSGDQDAIPEHAYLHSNSFLAPGMVSSTSTPSPAPQKLRRHTTCVEAMPFSSSMHPHSTSDSDLIQQQRRHGTMIGIGEVLYSSMIYQQSTADLIQQQRRHSMVGEVPSPSTSMYQQSNHNLPSRMMVPSNHSMMMSDHHRNMPMSVPSAQMAHSSTFRRSRSFEPLPFSNGDDLCQNLSFDNEEEEDPPDEFSQFIDSAIHKTE